MKEIRKKKNIYIYITLKMQTCLKPICLGGVDSDDGLVAVDLKLETSNVCCDVEEINLRIGDNCSLAKVRGCF